MWRTKVLYTHTKNMSATFYVKDTTLTPCRTVPFKSYPELVNYLDQLCQRAYGQTKKQRTQLLEEIGYGGDDYNSTQFVRSMQEKFEIGVVREGRTHQCDVTVMVAYQKPEYGD